MSGYDYYVTVTRPGNWNTGWRDGYHGEPSDPEQCESEQAYKEGYAAGVSERAGASTA